MIDEGRCVNTIGETKLHVDKNLKKIFVLLEHSLFDKIYAISIRQNRFTFKQEFYLDK